MNSSRLEPRTVQQGTFSPKLQHAVRLLQMSSLDFARALHDEAQRNPFLELDDDEAPGPSDTAWHLSGDDDCLADVDNRASVADHTQGPSHSPENDSEALHALPSRGTLQDHLHAQIGTLRLSARERMFTQAVVEALDDDGYLRVSLDDIARVLGQCDAQALPALTQALKQVQACDPVGVGARSVCECLALQLAMQPHSNCRAMALRIVDTQIQLLAAHDLKGLSQALNASATDIQEAVQCLRRLNAHPGWQYGGEIALAIAPDVTVRKHRGQWVTRLNASTLPRVRLHKRYTAWAETARPELNTEMAACLARARWTVNNLDQRSATIMGIARAIVARQLLFFEYGSMAMKPLGLRDVADEVGVHPSTVSRTVSNKYMATPWGLVGMRNFFSRGMAHSTGHSSAPVAVKELLRDLISAEAPDAALNDVALAGLLAQQGFRIARRTVTKYRQDLGIPAVDHRHTGWDVTPAA